MSTVLQPTVVEAAQRFVIPCVSWEQYVQILDGLGERGGIRTAYDGETLELMSTSQLHEWLKVVLGKLLDAFTLVNEIAIKSAGNMTFRREDLEKGMEPDHCYWIAHEHDMRHVWEADFKVHPPPDLCIEIEVSRTVVNRLAIYAALGVPEVWRFDGRTFTVLRLAEGEYAGSETSIEVPGFPATEVVRFLDPNEDVDENTRIRRFTELVHGNAGSA